MKLYDIIVIGGGASGMSAALYALRSGKSVLLLEKETVGGQIANSPRVENFPSIKEISGLDFSDHLFTQIMDLGAEFELEEVLEVAKGEDNIFTVKTNYSTHSAKAVIIATGVTHRRMNLPKEDDLITLFDRFFGDQVLIDRVKNNEAIEVTHNMNLVEYKGETELTGLVFENTQDKSRREYPTNNVFIAIGQVPHNEVFQNLVDLEKGYIVTDDNMMTKTEGLFAVGDTRKKDVRQLVTACNDGAIAALAAVRYIG